MRTVRIGLVMVLLGIGAPAVWAQTGTTSTTTMSSTTTTMHGDCLLPGGGVGACPSTTTTIFVDCILPGGGVGDCPSTTTTSRPPTMPALGSFICPLLTSLEAFFGGVLRDLLQPIRQLFGCH